MEGPPKFYSSYSLLGFIVVMIFLSWGFQESSSSKSTFKLLMFPGMVLASKGLIYYIIHYIIQESMLCRIRYCFGYWECRAYNLFIQSFDSELLQVWARCSKTVRNLSASQWTTTPLLLGARLPGIILHCLRNNACHWWWRLIWMAPFLCNWPANQS